MIKDFVSQDFLDWLAKRHVYISTMALFLSKPNFTVPIHTDAALGDYVKINCVFGGKDSTMNWFTPKPTVDKEVKIFDHDTGALYALYEPNDVEPVYSCSIGQTPCVVQAGVPHNATNYSEPRYCFSMVLIYCEDSNAKAQRLTMSHAMELFK